jgi:hypothetical protein
MDQFFPDLLERSKVAAVIATIFIVCIYCVVVIIGQINKRSRL